MSATNSDRLIAKKMQLGRVRMIAHCLMCLSVLVEVVQRPHLMVGKSAVERQKLLLELLNQVRVSSRTVKKVGYPTSVQHELHSFGEGRRAV